MLLAVVAVLTVGGLAMAANLGLLGLPGRSSQSIDAASGPAGDLGAPLVTAVPSEDGSRQIFVIDGIGTVQTMRGLDGQQPALTISDLQAQAGWKADVIPISPSAVRVEFRSARRVMEFEAFLADDGEIAARFRISPRGAPLVVTSPDVAVDNAGTHGGAPAGGTGDAGSDASRSLDDARSSAATAAPPATGSGDPSSPPTTGRSDSGNVASDARSTSSPAGVDEGTWIYYEDGVYMLDNSLRGSGRSQPTRERSTAPNRARTTADAPTGPGRSNGMGNGLLDDD